MVPLEDLSWDFFLISFIWSDLGLGFQKRVLPTNGFQNVPLEDSSWDFGLQKPFLDLGNFRVMGFIWKLDLHLHILSWLWLRFSFLRYLRFLRSGLAKLTTSYDRVRHPFWNHCTDASSTSKLITAFPLIFVCWKLGLRFNFISL